MALLYEATLTPSKSELIERWLPGRPWLGAADPVGCTTAGRFRFDDPAGEVGIETFVLRCADGTLLHVPLTFRAAELPGAAGSLVGRAEHSVLGERWVYDACADPVYVSALATAVRTAGSDVEQRIVTASGEVRPFDTGAHARGTGVPGGAPVSVADCAARDDGVATVIEAAGVRAVVLRVLGRQPPSGPSLTATWPGQDEPVVLAVVGGERDA